MVMTIIYPKSLKKGATIGVTAPSSGVRAEHFPRLDLAIEDLKRRGFNVVEGRCLRSDEKSVSGIAEDRTADFR